MEKTLQIQEIVKHLDDYLPGQFLNDELRPNHLTQVEYQNVKLSTDPNLLAETMFIAISNERRDYVNRKPVNWTDGNAQIQGMEQSLGLIVTETPIESARHTTPQFIVENSWTFMLEFAKLLRADFQKPVIAITGSVGKTTTRMLLTHVFSDQNVLENRGNHNTRFAIPLYMAQLIQNPDILNLEVSLNALNGFDTGSMSKLIKPNIVIITSIGEAHLSSMKDTKTIALYKAKVLEGANEDTVVILNADIGKEEREILLNKAKKYTNRVLTYSARNNAADVRLISVKHEKFYDELEIAFFEEKLTYCLPTGSTGLIENSLAALLAYWQIAGETNGAIAKMETFKPLPKTMEMIPLALPNGGFAYMVDDSHNAAVPSMLNAIDYFKSHKQFYRGKSVLIVGQIADLGEKGPEVHVKIMKDVLGSDADYIFGYGSLFEGLFKQNQNERIRWFSNLVDLRSLLRDILTEDSLLVLKGSVTGSDFHKLGGLLKREYQKREG
ncbi:MULTISPECIES: Mur ligase family protein [Listeria]|uniref:Mur ligase family protein n=1 Tax=Listeria TaxID=1637 RepID=UPI000B5877EC|nr:MULTISPECIES: Mur ligase family protein [Listeria]